MWKFLAAGILFAIAAPVAAQPIYFECSMGDSPTKASRWEVTYDEKSGSLSWDSIEGRNGKMIAVTNGVIITGTDEMGPGAKEVFTINGATGAAADAFEFSSQSPPPTTGICKQIAELPKFPHEQFTAAEYEFAAHFIALIQSKRLKDAKQMLTRNASIRTWMDDKGVQRPFGEFARYISHCPVRRFEGVNTWAAHNINVDLDCPDEGGASFEFSAGGISSITYGPPPPVIRPVAVPHQ